MTDPRPSAPRPSPANAGTPPPFAATVRPRRAGAVRQAVFVALGCVLFVAAWQVASLRTHRLALASPGATTAALAALVRTNAFWAQFGASLGRMFASILAGAAVGFFLGVAAGLSRDLKHLLEPFRWVAMSVPPVTVLVLAMLWLGIGAQTVVFMTAFLLAPIIYVNTVKGMELVERSLVEVAAVYRLPLAMRVRHIYTPALAAPLAAGLVQVVCSGVRVVILAEYLGANTGIGAAVKNASANLDVPTLYAWMLVSVGLVALFEHVLLRPLQHRMLRWREPA